MSGDQRDVDSPSSTNPSTSSDAITDSDIVRTSNSTLPDDSNNKKPLRNAAAHPNLQQGHSSVTTTFHGFGSLPRELQIKIWENAVDSLPTVAKGMYEFEFVLAQQKSLAKTRRDPCLVACFQPSKQLIIQTHGHRALLKACPPSRYLVLKNFDMLPFQHVISLQSGAKKIRCGCIPFNTNDNWLVIRELAKVVEQTRRGNNNIELPDSFDISQVFARMRGFDFAPMVKNVGVEVSWAACGTNISAFHLCVEHLLKKLNRVRSVGLIATSLLKGRFKIPEDLFWHYHHTQALSPSRRHAVVRGFHGERNWSHSHEAHSLTHKCLTITDTKCAQFIQNSQYISGTHLPWCCRPGHCWHNPNCNARFADAISLAHHLITL